MSDPDLRAIAHLSAHLLAAVNRSDVEGVIAAWAEDGVMMPPDVAAVRGRPAIEAYFRRLFSNARFRFMFTRTEVLVLGDVASECVTYTAQVWADGASDPMRDAGKGLHIFRRLPTGEWVLAVDIWNSVPPEVS